VTPRIRWSLIVAQVKTPRAAYAIKDAVKRFTALPDPSPTALGISPAGSRLLNGSTWCTGKDSNLRTPLGGADLQSAGFNHSPTCAETIGRCSRCAPSGSHLHADPRSALPVNPQNKTQHSHTCTSANKGPQFKVSQTQISQIRETKNRARKTARRSLHAGKVPNGVRLEKPVAPLSTPRLPEIRFLELAKGFEPLTL
jgi:hypothetical protein